MTDQHNTTFFDDPTSKNGAPEVLSATEIYQEFIGKLQSERLTLIPRRGGLYGNHELRRWHRPLFSNEIDHDDDFGVWLPAGVDGLERLTVALTKVSKNCLHYWDSILGARANHSPPAVYAAKQLQALENELLVNPLKAHELGINLSGTFNWDTLAYLPLPEWFPDRIRELTFEDICTFLPRAESDTLKLAIARAVVGRDNNLHCGAIAPIRHTWRTAIVLVSDPGIGKTYFLERGLWQALRSVGYTVSTFRSLSDRFNLGDIVGSHVIYKDDTSLKELGSMISSSSLKVIATGGTIRTEDKGVDAVSVPSHSVVICCANDFDPRLSWSIDPGIESRLALLQCYTNGELDNHRTEYASEWTRQSPSLRPEVHVNWLAKRLEVPVNTLYLWLARLCADDFMTTIANQGIGQNDLKDRIVANGERHALRFFRDTTQQVMLAAWFAWLKSEGLPPDSPMPDICGDDNSDFGSWLGAYSKLTDDDKSKLESHWKSQECPAYHPYKGSISLLTATLPDALSAYHEAQVARKPKPEAYKSLFGNLYVAEGFPVTSDFIWLTRKWEDIRRRHDDLVPIFKDCLSLFR